MNRCLLILLTTLATALGAPALRATPSLGLERDIVIEVPPSAGAFPLVTADRAAPFWYDADDYPGVLRALGDLDGRHRARHRAQAGCIHDLPAHTQPVIVGTLGKSAVIDSLVREGKLDAGDSRASGSRFVIQTVANPCRAWSRPWSSPAATSAARSTASTISPSRSAFRPGTGGPTCRSTTREALVRPGPGYVQGEPAVKYRGIFLNDEAPRSPAGCRRSSAAINHEFYAQRLRAPAAAAGQLPLAGDVGQRLQRGRSAESRARGRIRHRHGHFPPGAHAARAEGVGPAVTETRAAGITRNNGETLRDLLARGHPAQQELREHRHHRHARRRTTRRWLRAAASEHRRCWKGSSPTSGRSSREEVNPDVTKVPQLWALYKEVQEYYDARHARARRRHAALVPTTTGAISAGCRRPKSANAAAARGSTTTSTTYGGPRSYQWINTNPIPKIWEQMSLAQQYGADRIWIVNVGTSSRMEFPIEFFLDCLGPGALDEGQARRSTPGSGPSASSARSMPRRSPTSSRVHEVQRPAQARAPDAGTFSLSTTAKPSGSWSVAGPDDTRREALRAPPGRTAGRVLPVRAPPDQGFGLGGGDVHRRRPQPALCPPGPGEYQRRGESHAGALRAGRGALRLLQQATGGRKMEPSDGPAPPRPVHLGASPHQLDARGLGDPAD